MALPPVNVPDSQSLPPSAPAAAKASLLASLGLGRYTKFIASLVGELIVYLQLYGASWHLVPAAVMIGAALGVYAAPNTKPPVV